MTLANCINCGITKNCYEVGIDGDRSTIKLKPLNDGASELSSLTTNLDRRSLSRKNFLLSEEQPTPLYFCGDVETTSHSSCITLFLQKAQELGLVGTLTKGENINVKAEVEVEFEVGDKKEIRSITEQQYIVSTYIFMDKKVAKVIPTVMSNKFD